MYVVSIDIILPYFKYYHLQSNARVITYTGEDK